MNGINVDTPHKKYKIIFEETFTNLPNTIQSLNKKYSKIAIITDSNVGPIYTNELKQLLEPLGIEILDFTFPSGEKNKNYKIINTFYEFLINNLFDRQSLLIALGGGVTGDMVGFTAATYMRGIDFVQVPTSLLAQVDSSIGGKTGIDFNGYKNIIGAFYQPELVYINTSTLKTLPKIEFNSGMGELIKHGFIMDSNYLDRIEATQEAVKALEHEALSQLIARSCEIKAEIVSQDEKEQGIRAILNFGHTIGHAIERLMNFTKLHGECVALGMIASSHISYALGDITKEELLRVERIVKLFDLPTTVFGLDSDLVYNELFYDKKTNHNKINIVLLKGLGHCYQNRNLDEKIIKEGLKVILK